MKIIIILAAMALSGQATAQGAYMATQAGSKATLPPCAGTWAEIQAGAPPGKRAVFHAGAITEAATLEVSGPGGIVASLKYPETKSWECVN